MPGHGRPALFVVSATIFLAVSSRLAAENPLDGNGLSEPIPGDPIAAAARPDACLRDVAFVDARHGWAVGDCGVIWHTADGGEHWQQQSSGVDCRLESVSFIDANTGWAAGGFTLPYTHLSTGVILHTTDGGEHWTRIDKPLLPTIHNIKFFNVSRGCAIGAASALNRGMIFYTDNGGKDWTPIAAAADRFVASDIVGDFISDRFGVAISEEGSATLVHESQVEQTNGIAPLDQFAPFYAMPRRVKYLGREGYWVVGGEGLVFHNKVGGQYWTQPVGDISLPVNEQWRYTFTALAVLGPKVWVAGSPGECIYHSDDDGKTWQAQPSRQFGPIEALTFIDKDHGWAVGSLGTILATSDGGLTWRMQRAGADHVALLGIFSEASDIPLELFAKASANEGYLSAIELLNRRDLDTPSRSVRSLARRTAEALALLGVQDVVSESSFPLRQRGLEMPVEKTVAVWDQLAAGHALERVEARIVERIRTWRPEVVVVAEADEHSTPVQQLLQKIILQAIDHAAEPSQSSSVWRVKRVYAVAPVPQVGGLGIVLGTDQLAPALGHSLGELTARPRGLLLNEWQPAPNAYRLRLVSTGDQPSASGNEMFAGLDLRPGAGARRRPPELNGGSIDALRRLAAQRRNLDAILKHSTDGADRWLAQLGPLTAGMDESIVADILFQFGSQSYRAGRTEAAAQAFEQVIDQHPRDPLASPARLWLVQYYASSIASRQARRAKAPDLSAVLQASAELPLDPRAQPERAVTAPAKPEPLPPSGLTVNAAPPGAKATPRNSLVTRAVQLAQQIERTDPALYAEPRVRFPLAAAYRALGLPNEAEHCLSSLRHGQHDAWFDCAESEARLSQGRGSPTKPIWRCGRAAKRPRLDGTLDDDLWQHAAAVELKSPIRDDAEWPANAMLAYDEKFLYLAVKCRKAADAEYPAAEGLRPRSADLSSRDRIDLLLSPDRDCTTWYRISIDHRGWINTSCWGNDSWRLALFAAAATADDSWIVEAAIPWSELVDRPPMPSGQPWSINVQRIIPGAGFQSWSSPATIDIRPEGFGLLQFE